MKYLNLNRKKHYWSKHSPVFTTKLDWVRGRGLLFNTCISLYQHIYLISLAVPLCKFMHAQIYVATIAVPAQSSVQQMQRHYFAFSLTEMKCDTQPAADSWVSAAGWDVSASSLLCSWSTQKAWKLTLAVTNKGAHNNKNAHIPCWCINSFYFFLNSNFNLRAFSFIHPSLSLFSLCLVLKHLLIFLQPPPIHNT